MKGRPTGRPFFMPVSSFCAAGRPLRRDEQLHAFHPLYRHLRSDGDDGAVAAAGGPGLAVYVHRAGAGLVVDVLRHPGVGADGPVQVGGHRLGAHLPHQGPGGGQSHGGNHQKQRRLEPQGRSQERTQQRRHGAAHEPDGYQSGSGRLQGAKHNDCSQPNPGHHHTPLLYHRSFLQYSTPPEKKPLPFSAGILRLRFFRQSVILYHYIFIA